MSGYAKVGWLNSSVSFYPNNYYPLGDMTPEGLIANVPNGGFEFSDANNLPLSWTMNGGTGVSVKTVVNPDGENIATGTVFSLGNVLISTSTAINIPQGTFYFSSSTEINVVASSTSININPNVFYSNTFTSSSDGVAYGDVVYKNGDGSFYKAKTSLRMKKGVTYKIYNTSSKPVKIINNPVEAQTEKICYKKDRTGSCIIYTPEGRNFLKLTASYGDFSSAFTSPGEEANVEANSNYSISAYINTSRLSNGTARISVEQFKENNDGSLTSLGFVSTDSVISLSNNNPWTFKLAQFTTASTASKIKIILFADNNPQGDFYFDNIDIKPVLKSQDNWRTPQSCRLYPKEDALSCDYEEDSGIRYKGWYGHCLEYDRYPGDLNVCLLWWSVPFTTDRVNEWCGDGHVNGQEDCEATTSNRGTSRNNQYSCVNCSWSNGWCGDNVIENIDVNGDNVIENIDVNYEQCDWNEIAPNAPNLNNLTCWNHPNNLTEFVHGAGAYAYDDYLHGYLGCYDSSSANKCKVKTTSCSDSLVSDNTHHHNREDCIRANGVVWAENGSENWQVTEAGGILLDSASAGNEKNGATINYFCKFQGGSCGGGMTQYSNWSETQDESCTTRRCCGSRKTCNTGSHGWGGNVGQESCSTSACGCGGCDVCEKSCEINSSIIAIGCY